jgi:YHS domain-containing protein
LKGFSAQLPVRIEGTDREMEVVMNRRTAFAVVALLALPQFAVAPALGAEPEIFTGLVPGTAVGGYDAVAYHTQGKPVQGSTEFTHQWKGAEWRFASRENLETFRADPEAYAPQFGGYCAYGVAKGYAVKGEPEVWKVVDGKLYLNYDARVQRSWESDIPGYIAEAGARWPDVLQ